MQSLNLRESRGEAIAMNFGSVQRVDAHAYKVRSQTRDTAYDVQSGELGWLCSCPDFGFRGMKCKHIFAVEISWTLRQRVEAQTKEIGRVGPIHSQACIACGSANLMKWGVRHNKAGDIQRFQCRQCERSFTVNIGFERM